MLQLLTVPRPSPIAQPMCVGVVCALH